MSKSPNKPRCPHCNEQLSKLEMPLELGYDDPIQLVCFNDDCSYFREGWIWMREQYNVNASYRYREDPSTGKGSPLAVWSYQALRERVVEG